MDKRPEELYEDKVNAGRGVAKDLDTTSDSVSNEDKSKDSDRLDDRARKAGCQTCFDRQLIAQY